MSRLHIQQKVLLVPWFSEAVPRRAVTRLLRINGLSVDMHGSRSRGTPAELPIWVPLVRDQ